MNSVWKFLRAPWTDEDDRVSVTTSDGKQHTLWKRPRGLDFLNFHCGAFAGMTICSLVPTVMPDWWIYFMASLVILVFIVIRQVWHEKR